MAAVDYVDFYMGSGINILPIESGNKHPSYSWKSYQETKYDKPDTLKTHGGNFFVICGKVSDNLKVLDIECWDIYERYFSDIESFTVKTPHGGVHIYYKNSEDINRIASVNGWPVEIRGEGCGCTSAGSTFEGKHYEVIKDLPIIKQDLSQRAHERLAKLSDDRETDIQSWKKKIDISKVIGQTVENKVQLKDCWMGICPFHADTNPSLAVYKDNYYCFGCGEHGDVIDWVEKRDKIGFKEAVRRLSKEFDVVAPKIDKPQHIDLLFWRSEVTVGAKTFEVEIINISIFINKIDVTAIVYGRLNREPTLKAGKRDFEAQKILGVDEPEWNDLLGKVTDILRNHVEEVVRENECHFVYISYTDDGKLVVIPLIEDISSYLIYKFHLMAISEEIQVEGLELWIRGGNDYRQLPKSDTFLLKEMQEVMKKYYLYGSDLSKKVDTGWIDRVEILRQVKIKRIVQPKRGMYPVVNGIFDIKNERLITEDDGKICLVRSGIKPDPDVKCPEIDKFLDGIFNRDQNKIEAFLSWVGAIVAGINPQIIIMFKSRGRSGKGVLMELVSGLLGGMITMQSPNLLHTRFSNWGFLHRRMVYLEEFDGKEATIKTMKELSGGCPNVSFETKGVQAIMQAAVQCAIIVNTNSPPPFEKGSAWSERFRMLDFPNSYVDKPVESWEKKVDYGLKDKLMLELPGFFNKILPYAQYALEHPERPFKVDLPYSEIEESLDRSTDPLGSFIDECCELAPMKKDRWNNMKPNYDGYSVTDTTFMKKYEEFCSQPGVNTVALPSRDVKKRLRQDYRVIVEGRKLTGVKIKVTKPLNKGVFGMQVRVTEESFDEMQPEEPEEYSGGISAFDMDGQIEYTVFRSDEEMAEATA